MIFIKTLICKIKKKHRVDYYSHICKNCGKPFGPEEA